jgi:hypothetical protein
MSTWHAHSLEYITISVDVAVLCFAGCSKRGKRKKGIAKNGNGKGPAVATAVGKRARGK